MTRTDKGSPEHEPPRLARGDSGDPVLDELGRWFALVPPARELDAAALARVAERLDGVPQRRPVTSLRALAVGMALVTVATGSAAMWRAFGPPTHAGSPSVGALAVGEASKKNAPPPRAARRHDSTVELPARAGSVTAPNVLASPSSSSAQAPSPVTLRSERSPDPAGAETASGTAALHDLAHESAVLERALTALRREHDAVRALDLLNRYAAEFPAGVLRLEADVARIDANLALGNEAAALALLERVPLEHVGRGLELRLLRGELRAKHDCRAAILDFELVLGAHPAQGFDERALYGRGNCRRALGELAGANADFAAYLARYPQGRFAAVVRGLSR